VVSFDSGRYRESNGTPFVCGDGALLRVAADVPVKGAIDYLANGSELRKTAYIAVSGMTSGIRWWWFHFLNTMKSCTIFIWACTV
jgi:hypothetical protein